MNFIFADLWRDVLLNFTSNNVNTVCNKYEYMPLTLTATESAIPNRGRWVYTNTGV